MTTEIDELYRTLSLRLMPEDVLAIFLRHNIIPQKVRENIPSRIIEGRFSSMRRDWHTAPGGLDLATKAVRIFEHHTRKTILDVPDVPNLSESDGDWKDPKTLQNVTDWLYNLPIQGKRAQNRRARMVKRMLNKSERMGRNLTLETYKGIAKHGGVHFIKRSHLKDYRTAAYVAYMNANLNRRSVFQLSSQSRAYDTIAEALLQWAQEDKPSWKAIAWVDPKVEHLTKLSDNELGRMLGSWTKILKELASLLRIEAEKNNLDVERMVVRRGQDSSTWNALAGSWNKARDAWFALVYAMQLDDILEDFCPGKVLRLMAADLVSYHGSLHPDTHVWANLPRPWDVFSKKATCSAKLIREVCDTQRVGHTSWILPRPKGKAAAFTRTPELVHGVAIESPYLAAILRKEGFFSGKTKKNSLY